MLLALGEALGSGNPPHPTDELGVVDLFSDAFGAMHLWSSTWAADLERLGANAELLAASASDWLEAVRSHPALAPLVPGREQHWAPIGSQRPPTQGEFAPPGRPAAGAAALLPCDGGLRTWTPFDGERLVGWPEAISEPEVPVWRCRPAADARVLEVRSAQTWAGIVAEHPLRLDPRVDRLPGGFAVPTPLYGLDWARAARDWDVVRFPLDGLARIAFVPLRVRDGWTVYHDDVGLEYALWLRWAFASDGFVGPAPSGR